MRQKQCTICHHYAIYIAFGKEICARCMEKERTKAANEGVKNANNP